MGKYRISGTFDVSTSFDPDGTFLGLDEFEEVEVNTYSTARQDLEATVPVTFVTEAESEDDARYKADVAMGNATYSESDDIGWQIDDYSIDDVECIEQPKPTIGEAVETLTDYAANAEEDDEIAAAVDVLLEAYRKEAHAVETLSLKVDRLEAVIETLTAKVNTIAEVTTA